jgi:elongator complex protein 3
LNDYFAAVGTDKKDVLERAKEINETTAIRCIGLTEETRPDCSFLVHANQMLDHGVTRVELGVQSVYNEVLDITFRAHTVEDSAKATQVLKDLGFKVNFHMMTAMPLTTPEMDKQNLHEIFENPAFKPDMLKVYPTLVMPGTKLFTDYKAGKYIPMRLEATSKMLGDFLPFVPPYCRIMRIQRDIPSTLVADGVLKTNLKQYVDQYMDEKGLVCRDIRAREIARLKITDPKPPVNEIIILEYEASGGTEFFISMEDTANDILHGFCRLRFPKECLRSEFTPTSAIIRELHVYGSALNIGEGESYAETSSQHKGFGKQLMAKAEEICKAQGKDKLLVISGVGVREYYRKLGYMNDGPYVSKAL